MNTTFKLGADCVKQFVRKAQNCGKKKSCILDQDNAPAHTSKLVREFLAKTKTVIMPQTPYSLDFFPLPKTEETHESKAFYYD